jgi:hypothetical protein
VKNLDHIVLKSNTLISDIKVVISGWKKYKKYFFDIIS